MNRYAASVSPSHLLGRETPRHLCRDRDTGESMTETVSLKALAHRVLVRDSTRDTRRDGMPQWRLGDGEPARQSALLGGILTDPVVPECARVIPIGDGEPGLQRPCAARRGRVRKLPDNGAFLHFCCRCGRFGAFGYGVRLGAGRLGRWYCGEHRPRGPQS